MEYFSVRKIAELLLVNEETVRRWIRSSRLKAERGCGRQGSKVTSEALKEFLEENKGLITSVAAAALGMAPKNIREAAGNLAGRVMPKAAAVIADLSWLSILKSKDKDRDEINMELLARELELENLALQLKNEIAGKQNELEMLEKQIRRIDEIINGRSLMC